MVHDRCSSRCTRSPRKERCGVRPSVHAIVFLIDVIWKTRQPKGKRNMASNDEDMYMSELQMSGELDEEVSSISVLVRVPAYNTRTLLKLPRGSIPAVLEVSDRQGDSL